MTRKSLIVLLIFVIIAGAIAGAFVFLNQMDIRTSFAANTAVYGSTRSLALHPAVPRRCGVPPGPAPTIHSL